ncbi:MAG: 4-(cytidine 5'-diphospho)-2-C-methyl-D-erythritol kinase [Candidatus Alcyoniella australis]|nr:4-(cytidine 5'-diphospho)-2-C-methyl-D-erythritol kinase [Candidatus Alcyoniella australis]
MIDTRPDRRHDQIVITTRTGPLTAPAKINLRLQVVGRRPDGYHELEMLNFPLSLHDTLWIEPVEGGIEAVCDVQGVPNGPSNLAARAARCFFEAVGVNQGLKIEIDKRIPVLAGLGGGSSDAASVLLALNSAADRPLGSTELNSLARSIGADVPFFLEQKPCWAGGIGEVLTPLQDWPQMHIVLVKPDFGVSTAWAFEQWRGGLTSRGLQVNLPLSFPDWESLVPFVRNDLEKYVSERHRQVRRIRGMLFELGALHASMTGSGPTVFGVFSSCETAAEAKAKIESQSEGLWSEYTTTNLHR